MPHFRVQLGWVSVFLAVMIFVWLPNTARADRSPIPKSPLKQTIKAGEWTFDLDGPERPLLQIAGYPTEIVVRQRDAGIATLLQPAEFLPCAVGGPMGCVPIDLMGGTSARWETLDWPAVAARPSYAAKASAAELDPAAQTPQEVIGDLARDLSAVKSFRYAGTVTDPRQRTRLNGASTSQGRSRMTLTVRRQVSRMILLPSRVFWNFNRAFVLANFDRTRSNLRNAGRWLATSKRNAGELGFGIAESEPKRLARCLTESTGTLRHGGSAIVAGQPTIVIVDRGDRPGTTPRKLYLAASGPRLPLRIVQTGQRKAGGSPDVRCRGADDDTLRSDLRFSGFNARVKIAAPKRAARL